MPAVVNQRGQSCPEGVTIPVCLLGLTGIAELGKVFELERRAGPGPDVREAAELWRARLPQG